MQHTTVAPPSFPKNLLHWAGHHSGGVKRLFDAGSGRPGRELLRTSLIGRLEKWTGQLLSGAPDVSRILLLVGGPGNGKTEAIEHTINCIDACLGAGGKLVSELAAQFRPAVGTAVARVISVDAGSLAGEPHELRLDIVQDASATAGHEGRPAPELLIEELLSLLRGPSTHYYLCCVNRGVLDDALIYALDNGLTEARTILEAVTRSVGLSSTAPSCWPLAGFPEVAVWPMDAESLLVIPDGCAASPAATLLAHAVAPDFWPQPGACPAGDRCPFCNSQALLNGAVARSSLLKILRWYELASGKRWSFRDLFTLVSYLLAGHRPAGQGQHAGPCEWAKSLVDLDKAGVPASAPRKQHLTAIFELAATGYQHALFHRWDAEASATIRQAIRDLSLDKARPETRTLLGLAHFISDRKDPQVPAAIAGLMESMVDLLDPALASPQSEVKVDNRRRFLLSDLDTRFSRSLAGGIEFLCTFKLLSPVELDLLQRLAQVDKLLATPPVRRKAPAAANRLQHLLRDFACRVARRSIGSRVAVVADEDVVKAFEEVVDRDEKGQRLFDVARQVKDLLNTADGFEVSLTTTFGQPHPPRQRQATLVVPARPVKMLRVSSTGRPRSPICYLTVGSGMSSQPIPLTYDLFKAVNELGRGLSPASLPGTVVALLDTTKAMLSGPIVRDHDALSDSAIRIGIDGTEIGSSFDGFVKASRGATV
jgi:hypothetical protein